jgi:invasion protein IalB
MIFIMIFMERALYIMTQGGMTMRQSRVLTLIAGVGFIAAAAIAMTAFSSDESTAAETPEAWKVRCVDIKKEADSEETFNYCEMHSTLKVKETGATFMDFAIGYPPESKQARGTVILPLGVLVTEPVRMKIDDGAQMGFSVRHCTQQGCFANLELTDKVLGMMRKGEVANISFISADGRTIAFDVPLSGFTKALKEIS